MTYPNIQIKGLRRAQHDMIAASQQGLPSTPVLGQSIVTQKQKTNSRNSLKYYLKPNYNQFKEKRNNHACQN